MISCGAKGEFEKHRGKCISSAANRPRTTRMIMNNMREQAAHKDSTTRIKHHKKI